jgi:hypothetical protein
VEIGIRYLERVLYRPSAGRQEIQPRRMKTERTKGIAPIVLVTPVQRPSIGIYLRRAALRWYRIFDLILGMSLTFLKQDRKPRQEESAVVTSSSFAPLSSMPHSNMTLTATENYTLNLPVSGAMHVHLPAKESSLQPNQDRIPSQAPGTFQDGPSSNKKEGKRKEAVRVSFVAST